MAQTRVLPGDGLESLPLPPVNPMSFRERLAAVKEFSTGTERLRDAGGPVTAFTLGPRWLMPPMVLVTSPAAIRDVLSAKDASLDKTTPVFSEMRRIIGSNLADLPFEPWKPRRRTLQPVFTKQRVSEFGGHMAQAAQAVHERWGEGGVDRSGRRVPRADPARPRPLCSGSTSSTGRRGRRAAADCADYAIHRATGLLRAPAGSRHRRAGGHGRQARDCML